MKKILLSFCAIVACLGLSTTLTPAPAYAATCNGVETSIDYGCKKVANSGAQASPIFSILIVIINFLAVGVGVAVVGGIVWGAFLYITANGNSGKTQEGVSVIINAVIGLVVFAFLFAAVNFLVPGGLFR